MRKCAANAVQTGARPYPSGRGPGENEGVFAMLMYDERELVRVYCLKMLEKGLTTALSEGERVSSGMGTKRQRKTDKSPPKAACMAR